MRKRRLKHGRRLQLPSGVWRYRIGREAVILLGPDGSKHVERLSVVTGRSQDTIDRGRYKITPDGMVLPSDIKRYIETVVLSAVQENP